MQSQPRYKKGDRIGGRYLVHQVLMGGMGEVYLCLDERDMVPVALRTFQQRYLTQSQTLRRAFEQEVLAWVALEKHPNLVRCFYMDTFDTSPSWSWNGWPGRKGRAPTCAAGCGVDLWGYPWLCRL
jgi:hypothetical protein